MTGLVLFFDKNFSGVLIFDNKIIKSTEQVASFFDCSMKK